MHSVQIKMAIIGGVIGITALVSSATTYFFTKSDGKDDTEVIKGQINLINQAHSDKNDNQDTLIYTAIALCTIVIIGIALKMFASHISKKTERRINDLDLENI